jgi:hypothetical protein
MMILDRSQGEYPQDLDLDLDLGLVEVYEVQSHSKAIHCC